MNQFPILLDLLKDEKRLPAYTTALRDLDHYVAADTVPNATYVALKDTVSRLIDKAWEKIPRPEERDQPWAFSKHNSIGAAGVKARIKQVKKEPESPTRSALLAFLEEVAPLAENLASLKGKALKRQPKSEEQKRAEIFTPPPSSSKTVARVKTLLEQIVDREFENLFQQIAKQYQDQVAAFIKSGKTLEEFCTIPSGPGAGQITPSCNSSKSWQKEKAPPSPGKKPKTSGTSS